MAKTAPTTKPTGIAWLGEVPAHWEVKRIKAVVVRSENGAWGDDEQGDEHDVYCYRAADFDTARMVVSPDKLVKRHIEPDVFRKKAVRPDHLLIEKSGGGENVPVGRVVRSLLQERAVFSNFLGLIEVDAHQAVSNFMRYQFWHLYDRRVPWRSIKQTTGLQNLDTSSYFNEQLAFPPLPEQRAIAAFLDERTARIDGLLARKQRLVQLLKEKRQALITRAVTRGLDVKVKLKESGVPWLGEVPEHWAVKPLKWFASCKSGDGISSDDIDREPTEASSIPVIGGNGLSGYTSESNTARRVIVIGRVGALCGNVHLVDAPAWISDNALVLQADPNTFDQDYVSHVLRIRDLNQIAAKTAQPLITGTQVGDQRIPTPPILEQQRIATFIASQSTRIDALITKVNQAVLRLQEYRTALISAAVTGKVRVPN